MAKQAKIAFETLLKIWDDFKREAKAGFLKNSEASQWIDSVSLEGNTLSSLLFQASDPFHKAWFDEILKKDVQSYFFEKTHTTFAIKSQISKKEKAPKKIKSLPIKKGFSLFQDPIDPLFSFNHFVETKENALAYRLLCNQLNNKIAMGEFNPIYLAGGEGSGKSHLLKASALALQELGYTVLLSSADNFTDNLVNAIRNGEMAAFRTFYRDIDILLIDDVDRMSKRATTQEEFFHTFNALHILNKQIILTSSFLPKNLVDIEQRLVSRFEWGVVLHIEEPKKYEEQEAILKAKMEALNVALSKEAIAFLLKNFSRSLKRMLHAFDTLFFKSQIERISLSSLSVTVLQRMLNPLLEEEAKGILTPEKIIHSVGTLFDIPTTDILGRDQNRKISLARQISIYGLRTFLKEPFKKIASRFGRDHSTIISAVKNIESALHSENPEITQYVENLRSGLKIHS